MIKYQAGVPF